MRLDSLESVRLVCRDRINVDQNAFTPTFTSSFSTSYHGYKDVLQIQELVIKEIYKNTFSRSSTLFPMVGLLQILLTEQIGNNAIGSTTIWIKI